MTLPAKHHHPGGVLWYHLFTSFLQSTVASAVLLARLRNNRYNASHIRLPYMYAYCMRIRHIHAHYSTHASITYAYTIAPRASFSHGAPKIPWRPYNKYARWPYYGQYPTWSCSIVIGSNITSCLPEWPIKLKLIYSHYVLPCRNYSECVST